jgi:hypothetical protein
MNYGQIGISAHARASELRKLGIPLDGYALARMNPSRSGLSIYPGLDTPGEAFDLFLRTCLILDVIISNDSDRRLAPVYVGIQLPWATVRVTLLADPRKTFSPTSKPRSKRTALEVRANALVQNNYAFSASTQRKFPRDAVLNHRVAKGHYIYPGGQIEGLMLAISEGTVPPEFSAGQRVPVRFTVFDHNGFSRTCVLHPVVQPLELPTKRIKIPQTRICGIAGRTIDYYRCKSSEDSTPQSKNKYVEHSSAEDVAKPAAEQANAREVAKEPVLV